MLSVFLLLLLLLSLFIEHSATGVMYTWCIVYRMESETETEKRVETREIVGLIALKGIHFCETYKCYSTIYGIFGLRFFVFSV